MNGDDTINSFNLEIAIYDDNEDDITSELQIVGWNWFVPIFDWVEVSSPDGSETPMVVYGLEWHEFTFSSGSETYTGNIGGEIDIFHDGTLNVRVSSWGGGDFYLASSTLTVDGDNGSAPVPEPATILLLGSGLFGLVGYNRKRFGKKS